MFRVSVLEAVIKPARGTYIFLTMGRVQLRGRAFA